MNLSSDKHQAITESRQSMRNAAPEYSESLKRRYKESIKLRPELSIHHQNLTGGIFKDKIKSTKNK